MVKTPLPTSTLYPDSDGELMADNTEQYQWIVMLVENLKRLLKNELAFVAGDLLWYPVQVETITGEPLPKVPRQAPDAMVAFGRPDGYRGSYQQWKEDDIAPQVVFESLSPSNTHIERAEKQYFYQKYGVEEIYFYDLQQQDFWGLVRNDGDWDWVMDLNMPWISPLLKIRFEMFEDGLAVYYPDGEPFKRLKQFAEERDQVQVERDQAQAERDQIQAERDEIQLERDQAQTERDRAQVERDQAQAERDRLAAKLKALGIDPEVL